MAAIASCSLLYTSPKFNNASPPRPRFSSSASKSPRQQGERMSFIDFPYVSGPHRDLMVDLSSTIQTRLNSFLNPCNLPPDVQSYQNESGTAHAALHLRSGVNSSPIDFILGSWLHCALPSGGALNITSLSAYLNSSTDAPNFLVELIQSSPTSMVLILDLPPRVDLVLNPDYLKTFYEDTQLDQHRQHLDKLSEVKPYFSSSLYIRAVVSPTAILVRIETEQLEEMVETHISPIAKEVLKTWLDVCAFGDRVVGESERDCLKIRDDMSKSKTIEIDLGSNLPRLFGPTTTTTNAHVSTSHFNSRFRVPQLTTERKLRALTLKCAVFPHEQKQSRRLVSISLILFHSLSIPKDAVAGSPFDKYVKRKKLEPLVTYVPAIILTELQIKELDKTLEADQPQYAACRSLLRAGPAASLRMNIRAVAQYANEDGNNQNASNDVDQCLRALEELDSLLLHASRNEPGASVKSMKSNIGIAVNALNSLLQTVPTDVLEKGKAIADAYNTPEEDYPPENLDPNLKQLESIL